MALQTSGTITASQIRAEFNQLGQMRLSQFYRGGSLVPNVPINSNVPTSGRIKYSNFYGAQRYVGVTQQVTLTNGQSWVVPATLEGNTISIVLIGGRGGDGGNDANVGYKKYPGYQGQQVTSDITVNPGDTILASVGGRGEDGENWNVGYYQGRVNYGGNGGSGGLFGMQGGRGGDSGSHGASGAGAGGGGATAIKKNGALIAVAAGGGGGGGAGYWALALPNNGDEYVAPGIYVGENGQNKNASPTRDGGGGGAGGGGYRGGKGGLCIWGDVGAYSGSTGLSLVPFGGFFMPAPNGALPSITITGKW